MTARPDDNCVLITGATGVVGSALVPLFLAEEATEVKLLVRAASPQHRDQRLQALFAFWQWDDSDPRRLRVEALPGDVCLPRWGLSDFDYQRLAQRVTRVVHAAGNVKLNQPLAEARRAAVDAVAGTLEFVRACQLQGQFCKLEVVSTVGVAGRTRGLIRESPCVATQFHNTYEQAKAEAELLVLAEMARGCPATIHRPSMVVGDSRNGRIGHFQVFYHLSDFLSGLRTWGVVPDTGRVKLDIIPVDCVARAIHEASRQQATAGRILHLCSGPERSWTLVELTAWLREALSRRGQQLPRLRRLSPVWFRRTLRLVQSLAPRKSRRFLRSLPYFLDYLDEEQVFDTTQADALLSATGWQVPGPERYLHQVMATYWNEKEQR